MVGRRLRRPGRDAGRLGLRQSGTIEVPDSNSCTEANRRSRKRSRAEPACATRQHRLESATRNHHGPAPGARGARKTDTQTPRTTSHTTTNRPEKDSTSKYVARISAVAASRRLRARRRLARTRSRRGTRRTACEVARRPRPSARRNPPAVRRSSPRERPFRLADRGFRFGLAFALARRPALRCARRLARRCSAFDRSFFATNPR